MFNIQVRRMSPYPPNFNKIPASNIEPETGASTWALGNQLWTKKAGNLTKKAVIPITKLKVPSFKPLIIIKPILLPPKKDLSKINNNKGREAKKV